MSSNNVVRLVGGVGEEVQQVAPVQEVGVNLGVPLWAHEWVAEQANPSPVPHSVLEKNMPSHPFKLCGGHVVRSDHGRRISRQGGGSIWAGFGFRRSDQISISVDILLWATAGTSRVIRTMCSRKEVRGIFVSLGCDAPIRRTGAPSDDRSAPRIGVAKPDWMTIDLHSVV